MATWYRVSGAINLVLFLALAIFLMFKGKTKRTRYMSGAALFVAYGQLVYGVILAET